MVAWLIRVVVLVAWLAFILTLIPATHDLGGYINALGQWPLYLFGLFQLPTVFTIIIGGDLARFVIRRFNP